MEHSKEAVVKVMKDAILANWMDGTKTTIDNYEWAITMMCGGIGEEELAPYEEIEQDWAKLLKHLAAYETFDVHDIYQVIYEQQPWSFMEIED